MKEELEVALRALKWAMSRSRQDEERDYYNHAVKALEALAQPEQEPVGFYDARGNDICIEIPMGESGDWWQPVYTTPPQRTWVGLTDEKVEAVAEEFGVGGWICDFARAIEAELKEKNDC